MQVLAYARWSSLEQTKGSSLERQIANTSDYISERGWTLAAPPIIDRGRSAYTGENITTGELGKFAERLRVGALGRDVRLVVEELDRLSRQPADVMLSWLSPLVRDGLEIHITQTRQIINRDMLDRDMGGLMMLLVHAFGSNTESRKKSERVGAAWEAKRNAAREGRKFQTNHRRPMWIDVGADDEFVINEERGAIIKRIFARRLAGAGKLLIAKELNRDGVETWANTKRQAEMWSGTYVGRILTNRAVMGEWQPHSQSRMDKVRKMVGEPIVNFYPIVIDAAAFAAANDKRAENQRKHGGRGRALSNLLGTKARCAVCGGQMQARGSSRVRTNRDGSQSQHYFLYCQRAKLAKTCDNAVGWTYDRVERPLLDHLLSLAMDDQHFGDKGAGAAEAERLVYQAREGLMAAERRVARWARAMDSDDADEADAALEHWKKAVAGRKIAEAEVTKAEDNFAAVRGKVSPAEHIRRVQEVREAMGSDDAEERYQARMRVKTAIGDIVDRMIFRPQDRSVTVILREEIASIRIDHDGHVLALDRQQLQKEPWSSNDPAVQAYLCRADGRP